jgi:hypothetical protein
MRVALQAKVVVIDDGDMVRIDDEEPCARGRGSELGI